MKPAVTWQGQPVSLAEYKTRRALEWARSQPRAAIWALVPTDMGWRDDSFVLVDGRRQKNGCLHRRTEDLEIVVRLYYDGRVLRIWEASPRRGWSVTGDMALPRGYSI